jgi:uncharacterized protein YmfQ (DUF2313 family)
MPSYVRNNASAAALVVDAFPSTTVELLPEWEQSLGLPDLCEAQPQTLQQRQAAVLARFVGAGGQTISYYTSVAAALGYAVTITEFPTFRSGLSTSGSPCGDAYANAWQVSAPTFTVSYFRSGASGSGEPLQTYGNTALQCTLRRLAPAHTTLIFSYS